MRKNIEMAFLERAGFGEKKMFLGPMYMLNCFYPGLLTEFQNAASNDAGKYQAPFY